MNEFWGFRSSSVTNSYHGERMSVLDQASQTCQKKISLKKSFAKKKLLCCIWYDLEKRFLWERNVLQKKLLCCIWYDKPTLSFASTLQISPVIPLASSPYWSETDLFRQQSTSTITQSHDAETSLPLESIFCCNPGHKGSFKSACFHILQLVQLSQEVQIHLEKIRLLSNINLQTWLSSSVISLHCPLKENINNMRFVLKRGTFTAQTSICILGWRKLTK